MTITIDKLTDKIGYTFKNPDFLEIALTHRSAMGDNNERLEFLGDSLVNFIIADALYVELPTASEGTLSRLRANLVNRDTLVELALEFDLGDFIRLGYGERKSGGKQRASILANAVEALIAAIYLDSDVETCRSCVLRWFADRLTAISPDKVFKDPKTRLQEYLQAHKYTLPSYEVKSITGSAHNQIFYIECSVEKIKYIATGSGTSRRRAEQEAAFNFLAFLEVNDQ